MKNWLNKELSDKYFWISWYLLVLFGSLVGTWFNCYQYGLSREKTFWLSCLAILCTLPALFHSLFILREK